MEVHLSQLFTHSAEQWNYATDHTMHIKYSQHNKTKCTTEREKKKEMQKKHGRSDVEDL